MPAAQGPAEASAWAIRDGAQAVSEALKVFGLSPAEVPQAAARIVTLESDSTPFLHAQITKRPIWRVSIGSYRLRLKSSPGEPDQYDRDFEVLLDPRDGKLLKIVSRWPEGVPESAPEPRPAFAEEQMINTGRERYDSFPDGPPNISFLEALDAIYVHGFSDPLAAKQIVAHYVMQAWMDRGLRRVWAINLRGHPPFQAHCPGVPVAARDHMRHSIDAGTGKWLGAGTSPQPEDPPEHDGNGNSAASRRSNESHAGCP